MLTVLGLIQATLQLLVIRMHILRRRQWKAIDEKLERLESFQQFKASSACAATHMPCKRRASHSVSRAPCHRYYAYERTVPSAAGAGRPPVDVR